ncbi:efflux RND transporter permease subunit [Tuwongella immobilis]|uniref:SSD domain-containing protein n=1 Tax=Tuwongella immobilis TaxID=692036 RepID=A0A6C2YRF9_9BACT|nr:efflux RND transporter permease subunit [Tuwongella immobilis]VIP03703.1 multidrug transporter : Efflux system protein OS=Nitratireductor pacificus pht-3B GN=NA2_12493 PE=4 SV=1: ACR_tran [Tuwongella immobilis]VTS04774.1 multidrug transporter : Efflux system protein OS=Nitratireductor pacificus pht-3B GN=NA2_12493 PE=4 SV=1: ACR_tran [Tuwongella immobilis]
MKGLNLSAWAVKHPAVVLFLILVMGAAGTLGYLSMGRAEDPSFTLKVAIVTAIWPGATADEVQRQVADKIEKKLQELPNFDKVETYCRPGMAAIMLQLKDTTPPREVPYAWYLARKKLTDIRHTLPSGVIGPMVDDEYGDVYSAVFAFTGDGFTPAELKRYAEDARQRLLRVADVNKVAMIGDLPEKVFVEFSHRKLSTLGITPQQIFDSLAKQNEVSPAGSFETTSERIFLRVEGAFDTVDRVQQVPIESGGRLLRLGDIAEVKRGYEDPRSFEMRHNGQIAVALGVNMTKGGNVLQLGERLHETIATIRSELPAGIELSEVSFQPTVVEESVSEFVKSFLEALAIVLVVSFLSLGFRTGIVVALSVPLVLAICFVVMHGTGMALDRITLGALIIALGLLVDDAIIAVEMMVVKMEQGYDRITAATFAWTSTAFPMLTGTLVTAVGFLPVGFAASSAGEYAGGIFWVVGLALIASWIVAVIFTPYLGMKLLPEHKKHHADAAHDPYQTRSYQALRSVIRFCAGRPRLIVGMTAALFVTAVIGFGAVEQQFFPQSSRPELLVEIRQPEGASFEATSREAAKLEQLLANDPDIHHFTTYVGAGSPRFYLALNPDLPNPNFAKIVILTNGPEQRERLREKLLQVVADGKTFAGSRIRINRLDFGPPVGFPVQFRVIGPDPMIVRQFADEIRDVVRDNPLTQDTQLNWGEQVKSIRLQLDQDRARALGLSPSEVSQTLQTLLSGVPVSQYREGIELIDVVARAIPEERLKLDALPDMNLLNRFGKAVPLSQVAHVRYEFEEPILWRRNRETTITVRADIVEGVQPPDVTAMIVPTLKAIEDRLPEGYRIEIGGAVEESAKGNASLFAVFPTMLIIMLTLLMFQVQSFKRLILVFMTAPLGLIGVTAALLAFQAPFGFVALLGVIALSGMIMRNTVILVDQIDQDIADGRTPWEAVIEATVRRSRPVVLTAMASILAMIPLSRSVFWGPMAIAIMGGLTIATILTLLVVPAMVALAFGIRRPAKQPKSLPSPQNGTAPTTGADPGNATHRRSQENHDDDSDVVLNSGRAALSQPAASGI